jgi:hypothetical protein
MRENETSGMRPWPSDPSRDAPICSVVAQTAAFEAILQRNYILARIHFPGTNEHLVT